VQIVDGSLALATALRQLLWEPTVAGLVRYCQQREAPMFLRIDKLQAELPAPKKKDPNEAAALQELLGGKYGEMSTLGNYMFQSFNFRSKSKLRPLHSLVASITEKREDD
jgi:hypothetical protein